jgi:hypothetical protein
MGFNHNNHNGHKGSNGQYDNIIMIMTISVIMGGP